MRIEADRGCKTDGNEVQNAEPAVPDGDPDLAESQILFGGVKVSPDGSGGILKTTERKS